MTSCTYDMPRSAYSVALETYHGASTIILRILDWLFWIIDMLDLLAQPHNSCAGNYIRHRNASFVSAGNVHKYTLWRHWKGSDLCLE
jgi:hypothetical protein